MRWGQIYFGWASLYHTGDPLPFLARTCNSHNATEKRKSLPFPQIPIESIFLPSIVPKTLRSILVALGAWSFWYSSCRFWSMNGRSSFTILFLVILTWRCRLVSGIAGKQDPWRRVPSSWNILSVHALLFIPLLDYSCIKYDMMFVLFFLGDYSCDIGFSWILVEVELVTEILDWKFPLRITFGKTKFP